MTSDSFRSLERTIIVSLPNDRPPTEHEVRDLATRLRAVFPVSDGEFDALLRQVHAKLDIEMDTGVALVAEHTPWLNALKPSIDPFYWERFHKFLQKKDWPPRVVSTLDRVTDEMLDLLGNPTQVTSWKRRGLVVGDVQSGKTATYTALCCKAGDVGYRLIILLTGTLESLRRQTQERLDEGFVGLDSSGELRRVRNRAAIGVGLIDGRKDAGVFTSREHDFKKALLNALGFRLDSFKIPVLVVVKKNKKVLEHLERWLTEFNAGAGGLIDAPVLVIDDEADSASVNTRAATEDPTAINTRIRALLRLFTHSSYIGFTATPFANVFIDPDNVDDMLGSDLFPRDFIYSLEAPSNYIGPQAVFGEEPSVNMLRGIDDADTIFPPRHKNTLIVDDLPNTLKEAARAFLLSNTIRDLRGEGPTHRSMLVNVSAWTNVQEQVRTLLHSWLSQAHQDIRNYSQLLPTEALRNETIAALHATWNAEFSQIGMSWASVQAALVAGALPVVIQAVNQRTGAASLDYAKHRENGLRVIAIGGNSLSRGLTLEGLSTSYFFRNSQMYDTLLQMGRWFGYQGGYRANIVAYTIAKLANLVQFDGIGQRLDFKALWNGQSLTPATEQQLLLIAERMFAIIVAPEGGFQNVTEWCKKELCWQRARDTKIGLLQELGNELTGRDEEHLAKKDAKAQQNIMTGIQTQTAVFTLGPEYWRSLQAWARQRQLLSPTDDSFVTVASAMPRKLPTDKQCARLLEIKARLEEEGYASP